MPVTATVAAVGSAAAGAVAANKQSKAQERQADANRRAARDTQEANEQRAAEVQDLVEDIAFNPVDPLSFQDEGLRLTELTQDFQQGVLDENRVRTLGNQAGAFEQLKSRLAGEANLQFGPELARVIDGSALARTRSTGTVGAAERLAADQRFSFANASTSQLTNLLNFESRFNAAPLDPRDDIFRLADFEFRNRQAQTNLELQKAGLLVDSANTTFATTRAVNTELAANDPGAVGARASAQQISAIGQAIGTVGGSLSGLQNQIRTQDATNQALALSQIQTNRSERAAGLDPTDFSRFNEGPGFFAPRSVSSFTTPSTADIAANRS